MNIEELTIKQVSELCDMLKPSQSNQPDASPYRIGSNYFIRTVTHHHTGKLVQVTQQELVLENAAWIADDGRLTEALSSGEFAEVELFPAGRQVIIGRGSIIDAVEINSIPTAQK